MERILGCLVIEYPPLAIIHNLHFEDVSAFPAENHSLLIANSDRVNSLPISFEGFQTIAGRYSQIPKLSYVVQTKQFSPSCPAEFWWKCRCGLRSPVIAQVLRQRMSEGLNHITKLSVLDNTSQTSAGYLG